MKTSLAGLLFVMVLVLARSSDAKPRGVKPSAASDVTHLSVEELIARFQHEPAASIKEDEKANIDTFVAVPSPTGFMVDLLGTPFPRVSPTMRELVRRGVAVIPALLDHLSDGRPTKLSLRGNTADSPYNVSYLGNEYDPRQQDADKVPLGLFRTNESELDHDAEQFKIYPLKVGDLCFAALGQIVNRRLIGWRNWAGVMFGFNSPVHSPALAAAARADWAGLTDDGFRDFLIRDVEWLEKRSLGSEPRNLYALERLLFYYPTDGVALAVKLLDWPLTDTTVAGACWERLIDTDSEAEQDRLLDDFRAQHGQDNYQSLVQAVVRTATQPLDTEIINPVLVPKLQREHENAGKLADRRFTDAERHPTFVESQFDCTKRREAVVAMTLYPSAEIDAAVRRMLKRVFALRPENVPSKEDQRDLVVACAERLLPSSRRKELEKASLAVNRRYWSALAHEKDAPAYTRACDAFLQRMAADPALQPPAGQP